MGSTQIPADSPWLELATASPTSGLTVSFTSLPEYKNYRIQWFGLTRNASSSNTGVRFNSDSGSNYAQESDGIYSEAETYISLGSQPQSLQMDIQGANEITKTIKGFTGFSNVADFNALWNNQSKITSIDIVLVGTAVGFTGGTIKIFGKN
jgi:hypothetical protein